MDIAAMLDALHTAYETLERPQISGLKTIHAKTAVDRTLQTEFDTVLSRISKEGRPEQQMPLLRSKVA